MNFSKKVIITALLLLAIKPLSSTEMWRYIPKEEFGDFVEQVEYYGQKQIIKVSEYSYPDSKYSLVLFDGKNIQKFSNENINNNLDEGFSKISNVNGDIFVSGYKNQIYYYNTDKEWKTLQYEDKYNEQNDKFRRHFSSITNTSNKVYFLSQSVDISKIDTIHGAIQILLSGRYNEIFSFDGVKLNREFFEEAETFKGYKDFVADDNGLWLINTDLNYFSFKDKKIVDSVDIVGGLDFDYNIVLSHIVTKGDYVYILKDRTLQGTKNGNSFLISYNKKTKELKKFEFPEVKQTTESEYENRPSVFNDMEFYGDHLLIASNMGIFQFYEGQFTYLDIFSDFLSEIPESYHNYLSTEDMSISGNRVSIITSFGLIYTDAFTDVENPGISNSSSLKVYPNIISSATKELTLESNENMSVKSIELYNMSGEVVSQITDIPNIRKGINSLKLDYSVSGKYFLTIKTMKDNFIAPLIIQK